MTISHETMLSPICMPCGALKPISCGVIAYWVCPFGSSLLAMAPMSVFSCTLFSQPDSLWGPAFGVRMVQTPLQASSARAGLASDGSLCHPSHDALWSACWMMERGSSSLTTSTAADFLMKWPLPRVCPSITPSPGSRPTLHPVPAETHRLHAPAR